MVTVELIFLFSFLSQLSAITTVSMLVNALSQRVVPAHQGTEAKDVKYVSKYDFSQLNNRNSPVSN